MERRSLSTMNAEEAIELTVQTRIMELKDRGRRLHSDYANEVAKKNGFEYEDIWGSCFLCCFAYEHNIGCSGCPFVLVYDKTCPTEECFLHYDRPAAVSAILQLQYDYDQKFGGKKHGRKR